MLFIILKGHKILVTRLMLFVMEKRNKKYNLAAFVPSQRTKRKNSNENLVHINQKFQKFQKKKLALKCN